MFSTSYFSYHGGECIVGEPSMISTEDTKRLTHDAELRQPKTIVLWGQDDLLTQAVEALLTSQAGWQVIRICDQTDETMVVSKLKAVEPQVLIVHQDTFSRSLQLLFEFVQKYSELRIITINLDNNKMEIFNKQTIYLKEVSGLMSIIAEDIQTPKGDPTNSQTNCTQQIYPVSHTDKNNTKGVIK